MMNIRHMLALAVITASGLSAVASGQSPAPQPPPPMGAGRGINQMYATIKLNLSESAAKMPEPEFAFRPSADVRTFGEILGHVGNAGFSTCAGIAGEPNPNKDNLEQRGSDKAAVAASL